MVQKKKKNIKTKKKWGGGVKTESINIFILRFSASTLQHKLLHFVIFVAVAAAVANTNGSKVHNRCLFAAK